MMKAQSHLNNLLKIEEENRKNTKIKERTKKSSIFRLWLCKSVEFLTPNLAGIAAAVVDADADDKDQNCKTAKFCG